MKAAYKSNQSGERHARKGETMQKIIMAVISTALVVWNELRERKGK